MAISIGYEVSNAELPQLLTFLLRCSAASPGKHWSCTGIVRGRGAEEEAVEGYAAKRSRERRQGSGSVIQTCQSRELHHHSPPCDRSCDGWTAGSAAHSTAGERSA